MKGSTLSSEISDMGSYNGFLVNFIIITLTGCLSEFPVQLCNLQMTWWRDHPKHVEEFTDKIKLCIVASCWAFIDIGRTLHKTVYEFVPVFPAFLDRFW